MEGDLLGRGMLGWKRVPLLSLLMLGQSKDGRCLVWEEEGNWIG